jgi:hypothetical protein
MNMKKLLINVLTSALIGLGSATAITVPIDLSERGTLSEESTFSFTGLEGIPLASHSLSLDLVFAHNEFIRLFTITGLTISDSHPPTISRSSPDALLMLQTNGTGLVGFLDGSAYLLDKHGDAIPGFGVTGSGLERQRHDGFGIVPLLRG